MGHTHARASPLYAVKSRTMSSVIDYSAGTLKQIGPATMNVVTSEDGEHTAMRICLPVGFDWKKEISPKLPGCPEWCPATHFGYLEKGEMTVRFKDGSAPIHVKAGDSYLIKPGHLPIITGTADAVMMEFSQSTAKVVSSMTKES